MQIVLAEILGRQHISPDAVSRRPDHMSALRIMKTPPTDRLDNVKHECDKEQFAKAMIAFLVHQKTLTLTKIKQQSMNFLFNGQYLLWTGLSTTRLCVPQHQTLRMEVTEPFHCPSHFATAKTYNQLNRHVLWSGMYKDTE